MNNDSNRLSPKSKLITYSSIKGLILKNSQTEEIYENYTTASFQYNDLRFIHRIVPNNNKEKFPDFNMETIEILSEDLNYQLIFGGHNGETDVSISIKDFPEEKARIVQEKSEEHFCKVLSQLKLDKIKLSTKEAIGKVNIEEEGFLGTWVEISLINSYWHISSRSKSVKPPNYCIIEDETGNIVLKLDNTDDPKQKKELQHFIENDEKK